MNKELALERLDIAKKKAEVFFNDFMRKAKELNNDIEKYGWTAELKQRGIDLDKEKIKWIGSVLDEFKDKSVYGGAEEIISPMIDNLSTMLNETSKHIEGLYKITPITE